MKAKLFTKIMNMSIESLPATIRGTKKAVSYSFVSGRSKKGNFDIYSFFNNNGELIKRNTTYRNAGNITQEISWYTPESVQTAKSINGKVKSYTSKNFYQGFFTETTILPEKGYDIHKIVKTRSRQKTQEISYKTAWDGNTPEIEYKNCDRIFDGFEGTEFLPPIVAQSSTKRINHLFLNQVKKQELEGIIPPIKIVSRKEAHKLYDIRELDKKLPDGSTVFGFCNSQGQVYFINDDKVIDQTINTIAHEVQHAKDFSSITRLEHNAFFNTRNPFKSSSRAKGIIKEKENPAEYKRLSELEKSYNDPTYISRYYNGEHDDILCEFYANKKEEEEFNKAYNLFNKLQEFLG